MFDVTQLDVILPLTYCRVFIPALIEIYTEWSRKMHKVQCTVILQLFAVEPCGFTKMLRNDHCLHGAIIGL